MRNHPTPSIRQATSRRWPLALLGLAVICGIAACASKRHSASGDATELPLQPDVDLARYVGTWYEQARLPNRFQKSCSSDVQAHYTLLADSQLHVTNRCVTPSGEIKSVEGLGRLAAGEPTNPARLEVRFAPEWLSWLPVVWGDYWIVRLDDSYQYSLVGTPDRKYLWVLSRKKKADPAKVSSLLDYARELGFEVDNVVHSPHTN